MMRVRVRQMIPWWWNRQISGVTVDCDHRYVTVEVEQCVPIAEGEPDKLGTGLKVEIVHRYRYCATCGIHSQVVIPPKKKMSKAEAAEAFRRAKESMLKGYYGG